MNLEQIDNQLDSLFFDELVELHARVLNPNIQILISTTSLLPTRVINLANVIVSHPAKKIVAEAIQARIK